MSRFYVMTDPVWAMVMVGMATLAYVLCRWIRYRLETKKPFDDLPMVPNSHWLMGHLGIFSRMKFPERGAYLSVDHADKNGQVGCWLANRRVMTLSHAEDIRIVLQKSSDRHLPYTARKHFNMLAGNHNLPSMSGKVWKSIRSKTNPLFLPKSVLSFQAGMKEVARTLSCTLLEQIASGKNQFNLLSLMKMVTFDVLGRTAFSYDFRCCATHEVHPIVESIEYIKNSSDERLYHSLNPFLFFYSIPTPANRKFAREKQRVRQFILGLAKAKREDSPINGHDERLDFLSQLIQNEATEGSDLIVDLLVVVIIAGYETTSTALCYAFYLLSLNPQAEMICLEEIDMCKGDYSLDKLRYCHAVVMEALRLYPSLPATTRSITKDISLHGGRCIPKDTFVILPIWCVQRHERHFSDPLQFCPERWVKQTESGLWVERTMNDFDTHPIAPGDHNAFFAFSGGGRSCPGTRYALQEETLVLAMLLEKIEFKVSPDYELQYYMSVVTQCPADGIPVTVHAR